MLVLIPVLGRRQSSNSKDNRTVLSEVYRTLVWVRGWRNQCWSEEGTGYSLYGLDIRSRIIVRIQPEPINIDEWYFIVRKSDNLNCTFTLLSTNVYFDVLVTDNWHWSIFEWTFWCTRLTSFNAIVIRLVLTPTTNDWVFGTEALQADIVVWCITS